MAKDYIPKREADLLVWAANYAAKAALNPASYGLTAPQGANIDALNTLMSAAAATANDPATRSPANIAAKNTAVRNFITAARQLARIIQAYPLITDELLVGIGLTVRNTEPTPIPAPSVMPNVDVLEREGTMVRLRLHDGSGSRGGKPEGVAGANIFTYVGATPPVEIADWHFEDQVSRTIVDVNFDAALPPGTLIWVTAFWYNPRGMSGPGCAPVSAILAGGSMQQAA